MDAPVFSERDRPLGHIEDFVVDTHSGTIAYAAIAFPDSFDGEKLFAIPIGSMELNRRDDQLQWHVAVEHAKLAAAPGFPRNQWPNIANRRWARQVDIYYGVVIKEGDFKTTFGTEKMPLDEIVPLERATRLIGIPVRGADDVQFGIVERLIFDRSIGTMRYIAVAAKEQGDTQAGKPETVLVPMAAAKFVPGDERGAFVLSIPAARLSMAPRIELEQTLGPTQTDWTDRVDAYFDIAPPKSEGIGKEPPQ